MCVIQKKDGKGEEQVDDTQPSDHFSATTIWIERSMRERRRLEHKPTDHGPDLLTSMLFGSRVSKAS